MVSRIRQICRHSRATKEADKTAWGSVSLKLVVLLSCFIAASCTSGRNIAAGDILRVEAFVSTAGPYGHSWRIDIKEYSDGSGAELRFEASLDMGRSEIQGQVLLNRELLSAFKDLLANANFNQLPDSISDKIVPFHRPDFRITACSGSICHTVKLYDPSVVGSSADGQRFLSVWAAIVEPLPLKPTWQ